VVWDWVLGLLVGVIGAAIEPATVIADSGADGIFLGSVGVGGEGPRPVDVSMAGGVKTVAGFAENPAGVLITFAQGEIICGDVLFGFGKALLPCSPRRPMISA